MGLHDCEFNGVFLFFLFSDGFELIVVLILLVIVLSGRLAI